MTPRRLDELAKAAREFDLDRARLDALWQRGIRLPDTREIWEWAYDEGELPGSAYAVPGRFDITLAPFTKPIFRALKDRRVRRVTCMASVQSLKTLIGELWLLWSIPNDPGPTQWVQPDDVEAKEHAEERFVPLLSRFPAVHQFYTANRFQQKTTTIIFKHMWLRMEGTFGGNAQRKSVKNQMCSEVWQAKKWKPGTLKEFASRLTQFHFSSKRYVESQPGMAAHLGVDDMHAAYLDGTQNLLHIECLKCAHSQPLAWSVLRPDQTRAGMRWDTSDRTRRQTSSTDPNEMWNWNELRQTVRYECIKCGHPHYDEPVTRRRLLETGHFVSPFPVAADAAPALHESFCWGQLILPNLSWFVNDIGGAKNFLLARAAAKRGDERPQREFFQKVLAEPYDPEKFAHWERLATIELTLQADAGIAFVYEGINFVYRLAGVDVQADSFWMVVQAWSDGGDSVTLWAGQLFTWEEVAEKQAEYKVPDQDVMVDKSHRPHEVVMECTKHGHFEKIGGRESWICWKALVGSDRDGFTFRPASGPQKGQRIQLPYSWPCQVGDPCLGMKSSDARRGEFRNKRCQIYFWSNPWIKDIAIDRRDGRAKGIKALTMRGDWNDEFSRQMHSQRKVYVQGTYGQGKWKWEKFRDDHEFDCMCMIIVRASQRHLVGAGPPAGGE